MTKAFRALGFCLTALFICDLLAQAQEPTPRVLYAADPSGSNPDKPLVLRYKISQYDPRTKTYSQVEPDKVFHKDDEIILEIEATDNAYLYVVNEDLDKTVTWILPSKDRSGEANLVTSGKTLRVPAHKNLYFKNEGLGQETLFFLLSRRPQDSAAIERVALPMTPTVPTAEIASKPKTEPTSTSPSILATSHKRGLLNRILGRRDQSNTTSSTTPNGPNQTASLIEGSPQNSAEPQQTQLISRSLGVKEPDEPSSFVYVASPSSIRSPATANDVVMWEVTLKQQ